MKPVAASRCFAAERSLVVVFSYRTFVAALWSQGNFRILNTTSLLRFLSANITSDSALWQRRFNEGTVKWTTEI